MFPMPRPTKATTAELSAFTASHPGWSHDAGALGKRFRYPSYAACLAFVQRVGEEAEARDHHPTLTVTYGEVEVRWSTHDAGGVTSLDVGLALRTDALA